MRTNSVIRQTRPNGLGSVHIDTIVWLCTNTCNWLAHEVVGDFRQGPEGWLTNQILLWLLLTMNIFDTYEWIFFYYTVIIHCAHDKYNTLNLLFFTRTSSFQYWRIPGVLTSFLFGSTKVLSLIPWEYSSHSCTNNHRKLVTTYWLSQLDRLDCITK